MQNKKATGMFVSVYFSIEKVTQVTITVELKAIALTGFNSNK